MHIELEFELEEDGRWIAEAPSLPGVLAYGASRNEAAAAAKALALRVIADRIENGEFLPSPDLISFKSTASEQMALS